MSVVPLSQVGEEFVHRRHPGCVFHAVVAGGRFAAHAVGNVLFEGGVEKPRLLVHDGDLRTQVVHLQFLNICPIDQNGAAVGVVQLLEQHHDGRLSGPAPSNQSYRLPCRHIQGEVLQDLRIGMEWGGEGRVCERGEDRGMRRTGENIQAAQAMSTWEKARC